MVTAFEVVLTVFWPLRDNTSPQWPITLDSKTAGSRASICCSTSEPGLSRNFPPFVGIGVFITFFDHLA